MIDNAFDKKKQQLNVPRARPAAKGKSERLDEPTPFSEQSTFCQIVLAGYVKISGTGIQTVVISNNSTYLQQLHYSYYYYYYYYAVDDAR